MRLTSDAIDSEGTLDPRYTCDIDNSSPELRWEDVPEGARGFAVLFEDLDGKVPHFSQWVVYQIPGSIHHLPAGIPPQDTLPNGIRQGVNGYGKLGYAGPCPPLGKSAHLYRFRVFALSLQPELPNRANRDQLLAAIQPLILAEATLDARYRRMLERAG